MKRLMYVVPLLVVASLVLTGCPAPTPQIIEVSKEVVHTVVVEKEVVKEVIVTPTPEPEVVGARHGGEIVITYFQPSPGPDIHKDAASSTTWVVATQVGDTLVRWDETFSVVPNLAESWEASADGMEYTFQLKQGVKFHNGQEFTAEDAAYSLMRVADPEICPMASFLKAMDKAEAVDTYTLKITMEEPNAPFFTMLGNYPFVMIPKDSDPSEEGTFIGTGPFMYESSIYKESYVMVRNPNYWGAGPEGLPYLDKVTVNVATDEMARTGGLLSGVSDVIFEPAPQSMGTLAATPGVGVYEGWLEYYGLYVNSTKPPFDNPLVREALNVGMNRNLMNELGHEGSVVPITSDMYPDNMWAHNPKEFWSADGDLEKAKALLEEAGYGDGLSFTLVTWDNWPGEVKDGQVIQEEFKDIGVTIDLDHVDPGIWGDRVFSGDFEAAFVGFGYYFEPDAEWRTAVHPTDGIVQNIWANETIAQIIDDAAKELDQDKRQQMYYDLEEALYASGEDTYTICLMMWRGPLEIGMNTDRLQGYELDGGGSMSSLKKVWAAY